MYTLPKGLIRFRKYLIGKVFLLGKRKLNERMVK